MRILKKNLVIKFLKIITLIIIIFSNSIAFAAVSSFVGQKNWDNSQQRIPTGVLFNPNGTKMYSTGISQNKIYMYNLTTPFTVTTATYASKLCSLVDEHDALMFRFNSNGTAIFVLDTLATETIDKYSLTTAYDISTCSFVAGSSQDFGGGLEMRSFAFSNDGQKIFIFDKKGNSDKHSIKQYSLSSAFDLSNPTLTTDYLGHNGDLNSIEQFSQGLEFSSDGTKMFITGNKEDTILAFSLSNPFDLTAIVTYDGEHIVDEVHSLGGITFSSDGSKMIVTDFNNADANRGVYQYDLTCGFGVVKCIDPKANKDDVASIESQSESAKKLIQHTTYPVMNRMGWLRRNNNRGNLTNQNINFQFNNEVYDPQSVYDPSSNYRFTPNVAGKYLINARISPYVAGVKFRAGFVAVYKNGSSVGQFGMSGDSTYIDYMLQPINQIVTANGSSDYFEIYGKITTSDDSNGQFSSGTNTQLSAFKVIE